MDLSIVTVTWNGEDKIADQIRSVALACKDIAYEQIIVDNSSTDSTTEIIEKDFSDVKLIKNLKNNGFGRANNQGVDISNGRYLLFLNPDMRAEPKSFDKLVRWIDERNDVGIVSCKLVDESKKFNVEASPRRFPGLVDQLALVLKLPHFFPAIMNKYLMKDFDPEKEQQVDTVRGSFLLMRREIVEKLGWAWDPRYFFWFEDVDICREARRLGYFVYYTPIVSCVDYVGQSFKKRPTLWKQKQFTKSMLLYFKKWEPTWKWIPIWLSRPIGISLAWGRDKLGK